MSPPGDGPGISDGQGGALDGGFLDATASPDGAAPADSGMDAVVSRDGTLSDASFDATVGSDAGDGSADGAFAGQDASAGVDAGSSSCGAPCPAGQKACPYVYSYNGPATSAICVPSDEPQYGCSATSCSPCGAYGQYTCVAGACAPVARGCLPDHADCDNDPANGCETDLSAAKTCGSCTNDCTLGGQACQDHACVASCTPPLVSCSGACRDLTSDPQACGSCTTTCSAANGTPTCASSTCGVACDASSTSCNGACVPDDFVDVATCWACGTSCTQTGLCGGFGPPIGEVPACVAGQVGVRCAIGYSMCGGSCVEERSDPRNCGACSVGCLAGQVCLAGKCSSQSALRVVTGLSGPEDIAFDSSNFYFTDPGSNAVWQVDKSSLVATRLSGNYESQPWAIAVDGADVYWTNKGGDPVRMAPVGGGPARTLYAAGATPSGATSIAVDDAYVYWSDASTIYKAPKSPDAGAPLAFVATPADEIKLDATSLYFRSSATGCGLWYAVDKATGAHAAFSNQACNLTTTDKFGYGMAVGGGYVYQIVTGNNGAAMDQTSASASASPVPGCADNGTCFLGMAALTVTQSHAAYLATDGCSVYWTTGAASIGVSSVAARGLRTLTVAGAATHRIAVDDQYVYWTDQTWVGRVPK